MPLNRSWTASRGKNEEGSQQWRDRAASGRCDPRAVHVGDLTKSMFRSGNASVESAQVADLNVAKKRGLVRRRYGRPQAHWCTMTSEVRSGDARLVSQRLSLKTTQSSGCTWEQPGVPGVGHPIKSRLSIVTSPNTRMHLSSVKTT